MDVELDHLFVCTSAGAPEADELLKFGLTEGVRNVHKGQGTACRRFFFRNSYLEFLWVYDELEARSEAVKPLRLWERWRYQQTRASPFGLALRAAPHRGSAHEVVLPFTAWAYRPPYLPRPLHIDVADNSERTAEPLLFHTSFASRPDMYPEERRQPLEHAAGVREITGLRITLPDARQRSDALARVERAGLAAFASDEAHLAEVTFDCGREGKAEDFRPTLPLLFHW